MTRRQHKKLQALCKDNLKISGSSAWLSDLDSLANNQHSYFRILALIGNNNLSGKIKHFKHLLN